jgi:hypothetical protein
MLRIATNASECEKVYARLQSCCRASLRRWLILLFLLLVNKLPFVIPWYPLPPSAKTLLTWIEARERMRLGVDDDLVQGQEIVGPEEEVEVLECFGL